MAGERIKGQEVEVMLVIGGRPYNNITAVRSMEVNFDGEIKQEGYLGESTDRFDSVFKGFKGSIELHIESRDALDMAMALTNVSRRRLANVQVNIRATFNFPNGARPARLVLVNAVFGAFPFSIGGRSEYGSLKLDFASSEAVLS
jgi:hypothetical protein